MVGSQVVAVQDASRMYTPSEDNFRYLARSVFQRKSGRGEKELGAGGEKVNHYVFRMKASASLVWWKLVL